MKMQIRNIILSLALLIVCISGDAYAQDIFKLDISKTGGKFADWVQKQQENYQTVMEQISESQFATFIGDGIKAAKEGIKYAQDTYNKALNTYNKVKGAVVNSPEYKIAMLSKEIAQEGINLKDIEKQKEQALSDLKSNAELERKVLEEKIKQAQDNFETSVAIYEQELANAADEDKKASIQLEIVAFRQDNEEAISAFNSERADIEDNLTAEMQMIEEEYKAKIENQRQKITDLTMSLAKLTTDSYVDVEMMSPAEEISKSMEEFSFKKGSDISENDRFKKQEAKEKSRYDAVLEAASASTTAISATTDTQEEQENISATSETVNGKSETVQFAIKEIVNQMKTLQTYLLLELKAIEAETIVIIASNNTPVDETISSVDVCAYDTSEDESEAEAETETETETVEDTVAKIKSTTEDVQDKVEGAQNKIEEGKEIVEQVQDVGSDLGGSLGVSGRMML